MRDNALCPVRTEIQGRVDAGQRGVSCSYRNYRIVLMRDAYEVCIIKRTAWDITMLSWDVHKPPTQAIRSIFVEDYTADELSVRAHSVFCTEALSRRPGTVHGPAAQSVSQSVRLSVCQSQTQLVTTQIATGFLHSEWRHHDVLGNQLIYTKRTSAQSIYSRVRILTVPIPPDYI